MSNTPEFPGDLAFTLASQALHSPQSGVFAGLGALQPEANIPQHTEGMTLRDYFAAKALQGICNARSHSDLKGHAIASAKVAYSMADAMLKARES